MRTHDEASQAPEPRRDPVQRREDAALLAQRALAENRAAALDQGAIAHLQRSAGNAGVGALLGEEAPSPVLDVIGAGGQSLDDDTRADMEAGFGHDFGDVRVHTDAAASRSAQAVSAQAYTVGDDIVFQSGRYAPGSGEGRHVLAHELAHVVQQRSGPVDGTPVGGGVSLSDPSDRFERAAEQTADQMVQRQLDDEEEEESSL